MVAAEDRPDTAARAPSDRWLHHASPRSACHGALPGQIESAAALIRVFERFGWATNVRRPSASRIATVSVR
jgi:fatty-acid desaturase